MRCHHPSWIGLLVAQDRMWPVGVFDRRNLFRTQLDLDGFYQFLQMMCLGRADNRSGHTRRLHDPRARYLRRRYAALFRDLRYRVGHFVVALVAIEPLAEFVGLGSLGRGLAIARLAAMREPSARQRTPRNQADALIDAERIHLALLLAIDEVVMILHRDEAMPAVFLGRV